jgi:two-component system CheB/CheR fusion protein
VLAVSGKSERILAAASWFFGAGILTWLATLVGLHLQHDGTALFWPAVGIAAGLLFCTQGTDRAAVIAGVLAALALGNLGEGRSLATSAVFMAGNLAEAMLLAFVLKRHAGDDFRCNRLKGVAALLAAGLSTSVVIGLPAAAALRWTGHATESWGQTLWIWVSSHSLGLIAATPLIILFGETVIRGRGSRGHPLSVVISAALLGILMPMGLLAAWAIGGWTDQQRQQDIRSVLRSAETLSNAVDLELRALIAAVELVAGSRELQEPDLAGAEARLREVSVRLGGHIVLVDRNYRQRVNTAAPPGATLPVTGNPFTYRQAFETGQSGVGDLVTGTVSKAIRYTVHAPVMSGGEVRYVLVHAPPEDSVIRVLRKLPLPEGWEAGVVDGAGVRLARLNRHEETYGTPATPGFIAQLSGQSGVLRSVDTDGRVSRTAYHLSPLSGWRAIVWVPEAVLGAPMERARLAIADIVALALATSLGVAWLAARALAKPSRLLLSTAQAIGRGEQPDFPATGLREVNLIGEALVEASRLRREAEAALRESEMRLEAVLDALPLGVGLVSATGRTLIANATYRRFVPEMVPSQDEERQHFWIAHGDDGAPVAQADYPAARALRGERVWPGLECEYSGDAERGPFWTQVAAVPFTNDQGLTVGAAVVITDIDSAKRGALALAASERLARRQAAELASIYDTAPVGLTILDRDLRFIRINGRMAEINGVPAADHIGRTVREVLPDLADEAERIAGRIFLTGEPLLDLEISGMTPAQPGVLRHWVEQWVPLRNEAGEVTGISVVAEEVTERKRAGQRQTMLMQELAHRGKNLLAVIQSIANRTLTPDRPPNEARDAFRGRLRALANTYGALTDEAFEGAPLDEILRLELRSFGARSRIEGPRIMLTARVAQSFALVAHELATNAAKYGALSVPTGMLSATWRTEGPPDAPPEERRFIFEWIERSGPASKPPARKGFGTTLITGVIGADLDCTPELVYDEKGFRYRIEAPLASVGAVLEPSSVRSQLRSDIMRGFYDAWEAAKGPDGQTPQFHRFDRRRFEATGGLTLAEVAADGSVTLVETGKALTEWMGRPVELGDLAEEDPDSLLEAYRRCARGTAPCYEHLRFRFSEHEGLTFERLLMPLSRGGQRVTHVAGLVVYSGAAGAVFGAGGK